VVEQRLPPNLCERNFTSEEGFGLATASANAFKPPAGGAAGRRLPPARASERMSDRGSLPGPAGRVEGRPGAPLLKVAVEIAPGGLTEAKVIRKRLVAGGAAGAELVFLLRIASLWPPTSRPTVHQPRLENESLWLRLDVCWSSCNIEGSRGVRLTAAGGETSSTYSHHRG